MQIFLQKQIFYACLPVALLVFNIVFWIMHDKCDGFKACFKRVKKNDHTAAILSKKRLQRFRNFANRARDLTIVKRPSALDVIVQEKRIKDSSKIQEQINAYKAVMESRGDGTAVLLTRKLIAHLHGDLNITTETLMKSDGTDDGM
jgi:hypothetical protein